MNNDELRIFKNTLVDLCNFCKLNNISFYVDNENIFNSNCINIQNIKLCYIGVDKEGIRVIYLLDDKEYDEYYDLSTEEWKKVD